MFMLSIASDATLKIDIQKVAVSAGEDIFAVDLMLVRKAE